MNKIEILSQDEHEELSLEDFPSEEFFRLYRDNPFDLNGVLVAPFLAFASGVTDAERVRLLSDYPRAVAISGKGIIHYGHKAVR